MMAQLQAHKLTNFACKSADALQHSHVPSKVCLPLTRLSLNTNYLELLKPMVRAHSMSEVQTHTWLNNSGHNRARHFVNNNAQMLKINCYQG